MKAALYIRNLYKDNQPNYLTGNLLPDRHGPIGTEATGSLHIFQ